MRETREKKIGHLPTIGSFNDNQSGGAWMKGFANLEYMLNPSDEDLDSNFPQEVIDYHRETYGEKWAARIPHKVE